MTQNETFIHNGNEYRTKYLVVIDGERYFTGHRYCTNDLRSSLDKELRLRLESKGIAHTLHLTPLSDLKSNCYQYTYTNGTISSVIYGCVTQLRITRKSLDGGW